jgi:hypothetical protein
MKLLTQAWVIKLMKYVAVDKFCLKVLKFPQKIIVNILTSVKFTAQKRENAKTRNRFSRSRLKKGEVFSRFIFKVSRLNTAKRETRKRENYRPVTVTERQPPLPTITDRYEPFLIVTKRYMRYRTLQTLASVTERYKRYRTSHILFHKKL